MTAAHPAHEPQYQKHGQQLAAASRGRDVLAWLMNVVTSVLIVFVNKVLMDPKKGHGFVFATTLCSLHFFTSALTVKVLEYVNAEKRGTMPLKDTFVFSLMGGTSIAALNLSLLLNTVGFYQIAKLLIIPFACLVEFVWLRRTFSRPALMAIALVVLGVGIVTVNDVSGGRLNMTGLIVAAVSVVSSGMQQILCGVFQRKHGISSNQMLANTAPMQGLLLLIVGPHLDQMMSGRWVLHYHATPSALQCLGLSCAVAALVNISQFMCLGRFHAVTFQVLGHTKTVLVLLVGWLLLGDTMSIRKLLGMVIAVTGMAVYGYVSSQKPILPTANGKP